ncbi:hypothetical protein DDZ15_05900 [Rhodohalobacter mucosus]|uniref:Uncharacterized protein n=2 Tax=Rhodohalobacter mucosus TaxID=2079485 RepID=A0A316TW93_9BACT|nr:hypothetical protein DDZ15_05900 [Rhodohalobacter mucosus]
MTLSAAALLILTGCGIPSVHPLYEQEDLIVDENLTGTWENESGETRYAVMTVTDLKKKLEQTNEDMVLPYDPVVVDDMEISMDDNVLGLLEGLEEKGLGNIYLVQNLGKPENVYLAGLIELNSGYYIDFTVIDVGADVFRFPVHIFMKATVENDEIRFDSFSEEWLMGLIKNRQVRINYEMTDFERFLLTAGTDELQKFVGKYGDMSEDEGIYGNSFTYRKVSADAEFIYDSGEAE